MLVTGPKDLSTVHAKHKQKIRPYGDVDRGRGKAGLITVELGSVRRRRTMSSEWGLGQRTPLPFELRWTSRCIQQSPGSDISTVNVLKPNLGSQPPINSPELYVWVLFSGTSHHFLRDRIGDGVTQDHEVICVCVYRQRSIRGVPNHSLPVSQYLGSRIRKEVVLSHYQKWRLSLAPPLPRLAEAQRI
jgi:hypothetical protein